jgi:hypothetical protein
MRFIIAQEYYEQMLREPYHTPDCYVRPGEYLHHMYVEGVKYVIAPALLDCLKEARAKGDKEAIAHLMLHKVHYDMLLAEAQRMGDGQLEGVDLLGDPPPDDSEGTPVSQNAYVPLQPKTSEETGLSEAFLFEMVMRVIYTRGRLTGSDLAAALKLPFSVLLPIIQRMRKQALIDIVGQKGSGGEATFEYELKPPRGTEAVQDALDKTAYAGPAPVPFDDYVESVAAQTIKKLVVTRRNIQRAFEDLIITDAVFNEIGPAINSGASIFLFGYPGNGKTAVAERITRLMGDAIYIPYAVEANGSIIKVYDPIVHQAVEDDEKDGMASLILKGPSHDERFIKIKRPTIVVGGELILEQLDLKYNTVGKFYEAPFQMKANGGIFMIDDFGRQQVRPMDLLNRWIIPLEKRYDYLTTVTGTKIEVPFDELLIFSTNLDPNQLADEAFLRRIKFKIEIRNPDEHQWRQIWRLVCRNRQVEFDERGIDYLVEKWYRPTNRPFRMCQPRDILDQMISIAKYNMERVTFNPDLIDAACATYFVSNEKRDFGAKMRID